MTPARDPAANHLLWALGGDELERLFPDLEPVNLSLGRVLYESGDVLRYVYFPVDCIVSLLQVQADGATAEIAIVQSAGIEKARSRICSCARPDR